MKGLVIADLFHLAIYRVVSMVTRIDIRVDSHDLDKRCSQRLAVVYWMEHPLGRILKTSPIRRVLHCWQIRVYESSAFEVISVFTWYEAFWLKNNVLGHWCHQHSV